MDLTHTENIFFFDDQDTFVARWQEVIECKRRFLLHDEDPRRSFCMIPEVAESWIRSRNFGVDANMKLIPKTIKVPSEQDKLLIKIAVPLVNTFQPLLKISGYMFSLHSSDGTVLYHSGDETAVEVFKGYQAHVGAYGSEKTIGTTAHSLSINLKRPVQLIGPENYCLLFENNISSACPILSENGEVLGGLVLVKIWKKHPGEDEIRNLRSHTLGWVLSMGQTIETQLQLIHRNNTLKVTNSTLNTTLEFIDEGIISVNPDGTIKHINREAAKLLQLNPNHVIDKNITSFFHDQPAVLNALASEKPVDFLETTMNGYPVMLSLKPVSEEDTKIMGLILRLSPIGKINALVNTRVGANAKFKFDDIIGDSEPILKAKLMGKKFADASENILLFGESGTGKELFAQAIHNERRPNKPFIAINCAAIPRNLIESELFGYEGGAFTGAERKGRPGKIELANGGTLFLDEIGDMPFEIQAVLLRVLEDKQVMRLGGHCYTNVDFHVIAATNQDLHKMIAEKRFRADLYYRLSILKISLPPLRKRGSDILLLCKYFVDNYCRKMGFVPPTISQAAQKKIIEYNWPGNVRQLENAMIRTVNLAEHNVINPEHLPDEMIAVLQSNPSLPATNTEIFCLKDAEALAIKNALSRCDNNLPLAADLLGMGKSTLYKKIKEHHLNRLLKT